MIDRLARWISILFDSSVLSIPIFITFGWIEAGVFGMRWAILTLLIVTGIPLAYLIIGRKRGWITDMEMTQRSERPRFIMVSLSSDVFAILLLSALHGPHLLIVIVLAYFCLAIAMLAISNYWKISLHMAGVGGFSIALLFIFGLPALWVFLSLPIVAWARLHRRKHTIAQLVAGAVIGAMVTTVVFIFMRMWFWFHSRVIL